ncbi:hypothetical protein F53441_12929 [Fusarium austroafricanum]|uniref:AA1-like domain-containing protein n=1 Tax=Fusarium austroafricanum TaxID=2364996 RepID=A0A8H4JVE5_9HYPO|nr:hypothetical protein F53441_12929 [Fusarium austroafricanum]
MKFTLFTDAALAIPFITGALATPTPDGPAAKRADCSLTVRYVKVWVESGLDRYRMTLITTPRNDRHLEVYCNIAQNGIDFGSNIQCFWEDGAYYIDISQARGPAGHQ